MGNNRVSNEAVVSRREAVRALHALGRDSQAISEAVGVSRASVKLYLNQMGLAPIRRSTRGRRLGTPAAYAVRQLRIDNPHMSMVEIANATRISHQRVKQILDKAGLRAGKVISSYPRPSCVDCGVQKPTHAGNAPYPSGMCRTCKASRRLVTLICASCEQPFLRRDYELRAQALLRQRRGFPAQRRWYCTKQCQGSLLGRQYGTRVLQEWHRESRANRVGP